jgi:hypothetical protein
MGNGKWSISVSETWFLSAVSAMDSGTLTKALMPTVLLRRAVSTTRWTGILVCVL